MATYQSIHTGAQIDEGVTKGTSAVQPNTEASLTTLTLGESPDALTEGQMAWNPDDGTIDIGLNGGNVILQTGQEIMYRVLNQTGSTIPNGSVVMAVGTDGNSGSILVGLAVADGSVLAKYVLGITTEEIANGENGYVTHFGKVRGVDTSAFADGDVLWADPAVPGGLTATEPEAPNLKLPLAFVINSHANVGILAVRADPGGRLRDQHDVELSATPVDGHTLVWNSATSRWEDRQLGLTELDYAIAPTPILPTVSATAGTLPAADGSVTIAVAASPTVQELLEYIVELESTVSALKDVVETLGLTS